MTLDELNAASPADFAAALDGVFEHAPWVAAATAAARPFATVAALHAALMATVHAAPDSDVLAFLRGHPELSGDAALAGTLQAHSAAEQAGLALDRASPEIAAMNAEYAARFGFPFILCVRRHGRASLLARFRRRLAADPAAERAAALAEIGFITRLRLAERVSGPGGPAVHGSLSTHVLDTSIGRPAAGVRVELFGEAGPIASGVTDGQGRTPAPLWQGAPLRIGAYRLAFHVGAYFAGRLPDDPAFLDVVPVHFSVAEPEAHYHIPLLVSPGGYTTYRGS